MISKEKKLINDRRNAEIVERYATMTAAQPLATPTMIRKYLANEYQLSPQMILVIVKNQQPQ